MLWQFSFYPLPRVQGWKTFVGIVHGLPTIGETNSSYQYDGLEYPRTKQFLILVEDRLFHLSCSNEILATC